MSTLHQPMMSAASAGYDGKSAETRNLRPGEVSSGTTIVAIPFSGGVVLGADSRVSTGTYVANRTSDKIAQLHDRIWCCRSGSAADTQAITDYVKHYLAQLAIETGRVPTVKVVAHLMRRICYENKDILMAGVIVGGWDPVDGGSVCKFILVCTHKHMLCLLGFKIPAPDIPTHTLTKFILLVLFNFCLLYTSPSPRDISGSRMPSSA